MDEKTTNKNEEIEIDLRRLFKKLWSKSLLIMIVAVLCAAVSLIGTIIFVRPQYQSTITFYVSNNNSDSSSTGNTTSGSSSINSADISASRNLVKSYMAVLHTRETLNQVIEIAKVDLEYKQIKGMVTSATLENTEFFQVQVTSEDPQQALDIANAIAEVLPVRIAAIIAGASAKVADSPILATAPSSPNYARNTMLGFLVGLVVVIVVIVIREIFDITIRMEENVVRSGEIPILAAVPDMEARSLGGYYYGYRKAGYYGAAEKMAWRRKVETVGPNISFAAGEAYKLLRTKILFSFADEMKCHVIGVSSALTGEGKSLTAANTAYTMSQLGKRVLLIDCDMRRPSVADKLPVKKDPGMSEFLSGQMGAENLIQLCGIEGDESAFHVISAGRIPPNPMELLSSNKMVRTLNQLRESYDYIILDLPPVGEVSDALAAAKLTDGILVVVRQDYCNRRALSDAIRQFEFMEARILGYVFNCSSDDSAGYSKKYYRRNGQKYYKRSSSTSAGKKSGKKNNRQR